MSHTPPHSQNPDHSPDALPVAEGGTPRRSSRAADGVVEAFTHLAATYEGTMDQELRMLWGVDYDGFVRRLTEHVPVGPTDRVLDVATGTARIPAALTSPGDGAGRGDRAGRSDGPARIVGLDITWRMLTQGAARLPGPHRPVAFVCASAMAMPLAPASFDLVICALGMHHMDAPTVLEEIHRALAPGGRLVLVAVGARDYWRAPAVRALMHGMTYLYFRLRRSSARARAEADATANVYTADEWRRFLIAAGFADVEISPEFKPRRPWYPYGLVLKARKESL